MPHRPAPSRHPLSALRDFARPRNRRGSCSLCGAPLGPRHQHLFDTREERLACCCHACLLLLPSSKEGHFKRVPQEILLPVGLDIGEEQWKEIGIPVRLAFFVRNSRSGQVIAHYPGPAGRIALALPAGMWNEIARSHRVLAEMADDVQALLACRIGTPAWLVTPIDECYRLAGVLRGAWKGFSGGEAVWNEVTRLLSEFSARARPVTREDANG